MTKTLVYLVGVPGAGKSTLMRELLRPGRVRRAPAMQPVPHIALNGGLGVHLGFMDGAFAGTDRLAMNVQPKVARWLTASDGPEIVLAEGDRLANDKFFAELTRAGVMLNIGYLKVPLDIAAARRQQRMESYGLGPQDPSWLRGRETKVANLMKKWPHFALGMDLDGNLQTLRCLPAVRRLLALD